MERKAKNERLIGIIDSYSVSHPSIQARRYAAKAEVGNQGLYKNMYEFGEE